MNILYIGNRCSQIKSGADIVNNRNIYFLQQIAKGNIDFIPLKSELRIVDKLSFYLGGLTLGIEKRILMQMEGKEYDYVFLSQSLLGRLARKIKNCHPSIRIICCYHNIERHYAREFIRVSGLIHFPFYLAATYNESLSVRYCDYSLVLNQRDSNLFYQEYGKTASLVLPVACNDIFDKRRCINIPAEESKIIYLFVGVDFFANVQGIRFFIKEILPYIPGQLIIAGKGMDRYTDEFTSERVEVKGYVEDLAKLYYESTFVVLPIFSGGGMKTKTAEALMYGKTIIGTEEAFEGYRLETGSTFVCKTSNDFICVINRLIEKKQTNLFNQKSRQLFIENYSYEAVYKKISSLFK